PDVHARVTADPLDLGALAARVGRPGAGAVVTFSGTTRDVERLDYEAYAEMAQARIEAILVDCADRHGLHAAAAEHRTGAVPRGDAPKGDVLGPARIAGVQAAKRTAELVPLAHPLPLSYVDVAAAVDEASGTVTLEAEARTVAQTGVEMEAMCACAVAALTVYDMVKGVERGVAIERVELLEKTGGRHVWKRGE